MIPFLSAFHSLTDNVTARSIPWGTCDPTAANAAVFFVGLKQGRR